MHAADSQIVLIARSAIDIRSTSGNETALVLWFCEKTLCFLPFLVDSKSDCRILNQSRGAAFIVSILYF